VIGTSIVTVAVTLSSPIAHGVGCCSLVTLGTSHGHLSLGADWLCFIQAVVSVSTLYILVQSVCGSAGGSALYVLVQSSWVGVLLSMSRPSIVRDSRHSCDRVVIDCLVGISWSSVLSVLLPIALLLLLVALLWYSRPSGGRLVAACRLVSCYLLGYRCFTAVDLSKESCC
jgi:hypothetical protein